MASTQSDQGLASLSMPNFREADTPEARSILQVVHSETAANGAQSTLKTIGLHAKALGLSSLSITGNVLLWIGGKLRDYTRSFLQQPAQSPVEILVSRASSGPPDSWQAKRASVHSSWSALAKKISLAAVSFLEPNFLREIRKFTGYEQGILRKTRTVLGQIAKGLPKPSGSHINPERVRTLPYEYNDPHLQKTFHQLRRELFPNRADLDDYKVVWRDRPMRTAQESGNIKDTLGYIEYEPRTICIGREMSHTDARRWIPALIHHELCHAVLGGFLAPSQDAHAEWFQRINCLHPDSKAFEGWGGWHACFNSYHSQK